MARRTLLRQQGLEQGFQPHIAVASGFRQFLRPHHDLLRFVVQIGLAASRHAGQSFEGALQHLLEARLVHARLAEEKLRHILAHVQYTSEQVESTHGLSARLRGKANGMLDGLLCFDSKLVLCHGIGSFY